MFNDVPWEGVEYISDGWGLASKGLVEGIFKFFQTRGFRPVPRGRPRNIPGEMSVCTTFTRDPLDDESPLPLSTD